MTAILLDGKNLAKKIRNELKQKIKTLYSTPCLAVVLVGNDPASKLYVNNKKKYCEEVGIKSSIIKLESNIKETDLIKKIKQLNKDKNINGILVQLPLPKHINEFKIIESINPIKDVDGFNAYNKGLLNIGKPFFIPCTPLGILKLLNEYKIDLKGKHAVIVGRSNIVGKPLLNLLLNHDATVSICHSNTKNLKEITQSADILIVSIGKPKFITSDFVKKGAAVIDVGINKVENSNNFVGDVDFNKVKEKASFITPVPGGIGPLTITSLLDNTIKAFEKQNG